LMSFYIFILNGSAKELIKKSIMARMKELLKEHIDLYFGFEAFVSQTKYSATTGK
jgi:predicted HTH domain antitoxin